jgi:hypothetical protein
LGKLSSLARETFKERQKVSSASIFDHVDEIEEESKGCDVTSGCSKADDDVKHGGHQFTISLE